MPKLVNCTGEGVLVCTCNGNDHVAAPRVPGLAADPAALAHRKRLVGDVAKGRADAERQRYRLFDDARSTLR